MSYETLFEPVEINNLTLKNRIAMAPMNVGYTGPLGYPGDQSLAYYATRARGGFGLIITECTVVNPHQWMGGESLNPALMTDNRYHRFWDKIIQTVHSYDNCKICIQLSPGWGRQGHAHVGSPDVPPGAPSSVPLSIDLRSFYTIKAHVKMAKQNMGPKAFEAFNMESFVNMSDDEYWSDEFQEYLKSMIHSTQPDVYHVLWGETPRELTVAEIVDLEDRMAEQTKAAYILGADAIEIHSPHGYLIHQFLSPRSNKRKDEYGGSTENRARFLTNIIEKIRKKVGPKKALWCRLSGDEYIPDGIHHEEMCQIAAMAKAAGVDAINVSQGSYEANGKAFAPDGEGDFTKHAAGFKKATGGLPIIVPHFLTPGLCETAIKEQSVDVVALGRQAIADPYWPVKVKEGREKDIVKCVRCQRCYRNLMICKWITCSANPTVGRENFFPELWMNNSRIKEKAQRILNRIEGLPQI